jgi:hypothetical protein
MAAFDHAIPQRCRYEAIHGKPHTEPLLDLYRAMARKVVADAARDDILGSAILAFMRDKDEWDGTSGGLYDALTAGLPKPALEKLPKGWPPNALSFGHRLPKINPALRANGWEIIRGEHSVYGRPVRIQPSPVSGAKSSGPSNRQDEDPDLREPPDDMPDDGPDDLFSADGDAVGGRAPDGLFDDTKALFVSDESAGQGAPGDGLDGLTISPQITGGTRPESAALTLVRHRLGAEVTGTGQATNGNRPPQAARIAVTRMTPSSTPPTAPATIRRHDQGGSSERTGRGPGGHIPQPRVQSADRAGR